MAIKTLLRTETPASRVASLRGWPTRKLANLNWSEAVCRQPDTDPDDWFPPIAPTGLTPAGLHEERKERAEQLCNGCPRLLTDACLELAVREADIEPGDLYGVRGALPEHELRDLVTIERLRRGMAVRVEMAVAA